MWHRKTIGIIVFLAIAFGIPWAGWTVFKNFGIPYWIAPLFCSLGGFAAAYAEGRPACFREFYKNVTHIKGTAAYIFFAMALPVSLGFIFIIYKGTDFSLLQPAFKSDFVRILAMGLLTGPIAEEFGWRGYLQSRLLENLRPIWVVLITALIWCVWHFPIFYSSVFSSPSSALGFFSFCITWSVFLLYVVARSKGSVWPAVILHLAVNMHSRILGSLFPSIDSSSLPGGSHSTVFYGFTAMIFVAFNWRFYFTRKNQAMSNFFR
jgi:membrane protease YdiL (CAAX protease family)